MMQSDSQNAANFLLDDFQRKIDAAIQEYDWRTKGTPHPYRFKRGGKSKTRKVKKDSARKMERRIDKTLQQSNVRESLCRVLQKVTDDVFEISKAVTPTLLTLIATGTLEIKPTALMFAGFAIQIARMGVSSFCLEQPPKPKIKSVLKKPKGKKR